MSKELQCPECEAMNEVPDDCYEPNQHYECECEKCDKVFGFTLEYYPSYTEYKTPCANEEPHKWKLVSIIPRREHDDEEFRCEYCDDRRGRVWLEKHGIELPKEPQQ